MKGSFESHARQVAWQLMLEGSQAFWHRDMQLLFSSFHYCPKLYPIAPSFSRWQVDFSFLFFSRRFWLLFFSRWLWFIFFWLLGSQNKVKTSMEWMKGGFPHLRPGEGHGVLLVSPHLWLQYGKPIAQATQHRLPRVCIWIHSTNCTPFRNVKPVPFLGLVPGGMFAPCLRPTLLTSWIWNAAVACAVMPRLGGKVCEPLTCAVCLPNAWGRAWPLELGGVADLAGPTLAWQKETGLRQPTRDLMASG